MLKIFRRKPNAGAFHLTDVFKDMPWLWAIQSTWYSYSRVKVIEARKKHDFWRTQIGSDGAKSTCYLHLVGPSYNPHFEEVRKISLDGHGVTLFDVMATFCDGIDNSGVVKHFACIVDEEVRVWTDRGGKTFDEMFNEEDERRNG